MIHEAMMLAQGFTQHTELLPNTVHEARALFLLIRAGRRCSQQTRPDVCHEYRGCRSPTLGKLALRQATIPFLALDGSVRRRQKLAIFGDIFRRVREESTDALCRSAERALARWVSGVRRLGKMDRRGGLRKRRRIGGSTIVDAVLARHACARCP